MTRRAVPVLVALATLSYLIGPAVPSRAQVSSPSLEEGFVHPPVSARPRALWDWTNGNFDLSEITRDLEEAYRMGLGGFDIWDVGTTINPDSMVPSGPPFMGDESVAGIGHAVREATRLGLELGLVISSSWNAGGPWVASEDGVMGLFRSTTVLEGPSAFEDGLPFPELPDAYESRPMLIERDNRTGLPSFYRDVAVLAHPITDDSVITDPSRIVNLTDRLDARGRLSWQVPAGRWRLVRYVVTGTGQPLMVPSPLSNGRMIDHFSAEATRRHIQYFIDRLQPEIGPFDKSALKYLYTDSYEANSAAWTPALVESFKTGRGYDPVPYLPALDGFVVENEEVTDRFLYDYRKTLSDLIIENHYRLSTEIAGRYGLGFYAEAGGPGAPIHNVPFEDLKALGSLTVPRGEFWNRHPQLDLLQIVKGPASAAHQYNQPAVEAEALTSVWLWQEGPAELKPLADRALCEGLNRFIYHTYPHTPPEAGDPGWVYNFGTLIYPGRAWWPLSRPFHEYLGRTSFLLQQGHFVGDVLYYYGDKAPNFVPFKQVDPSLGFGYDYDVTNSDIILNKILIENGRIVLPHGQSYEILVLPETTAVNLDVLRKIETLVRQGLTVVGPRPTRSVGLNDWQARDEEVRQIASRLWGPDKGQQVGETSVGKGKIVWGKSLRQVLSDRGIGPDLQFESGADSTRMDFIHRTTGKDDIYFVRNQNPRWEETTLTFRVDGRRPEIWDPENGTIRPVLLYDRTGKQTRIPVRFEPYGSIVFVFRSGDEPVHVTSVSQNGQALNLPATRSGHAARRLTVHRPGRYELTLSDGSKRSTTVESIPAERTLEGPWEIRFPFGWGAPARTIFPELISWTDAADSTIRFYSGVATYHKSFEVDAGALGPGRRLWLDLGEVREVTRVYLNGRDLGITWHAPYTIEVTDAVRTGTNHLVVEVANVLNNRLVGDARRPASDRRTRSNISRLPNAWSTPMAEAPLKASGLLGPVRLTYAATLGIE